MKRKEIQPEDIWNDKNIKAVKEAILKHKQEEIEKLAFEKYPRKIGDPYNPSEDLNEEDRNVWIEGYIQGQKDSDDKNSFIIKQLEREIESLHEGMAGEDI